MKKNLILFGILLCIIFITSETIHATGQAKKQVISTNKDKLLTIAVQGQIAPAEPSRSYTVTWDGKPKMAIGIGGINYNLKIGDKIFGWASGDRATMGVATIGTGESRGRSSWLNFTSIGNEVKVLQGEAKGRKGVIVGKFRSYVLVHFEDDVLQVEPGVSSSDKKKLKEKYKTNEWTEKNLFFGGVHVAMEGKGGGDKRRGGNVLVV